MYNERGASSFDERAPVMDLRQQEVPGWKENRSKDDIIDLRQQEVIGWADDGPEGPRKSPEANSEERGEKNVVDLRHEKMVRQLAADNEVLGLQGRADAYARKLELYREQGMDARRQEATEIALKEVQEKLRIAQMKATG